MFWTKIFVEKRERVLAVCDEELLGKRIETDKFDFHINKDFYGGKKVGKGEALVKMMGDCTTGNIVGKSVVELAKKHGFITEENIISIGEVPHAQFVKIKKQQ